MKSRFYILILLSLFTSGIFAQNPPPPAPPRPSVVIKGDSDRPAPPPPPAPLIYSAPDKSLIGKFSSAEFGITVDFPGKPVVAESKADGANINTFRVNLKGSKEVVEISDYDFNVEQKLGKNEIFAQVKQKYLSGETAELAFEKDIEQNGISGKEFGIDFSLELYRVRVFVINSRIYEVVATVTNWHILKDNIKEKAQAFNDEADRFFNSFKINIPAPAVNSDKKIDGKIELFKSKNNIFEAADESFRVYLPGRPEVKTNKTKAGFGETDLTVITLPGGRAYYGITYFDYPVVITDQSEIRFISDEQRDVFLSKKLRLISEKDISYEGHYGREYVLTDERTTLTMRNFFIKQRFFRLIAITSGVKDKLPPILAERNNQAVYRFLDSFESGKMPAAEFSEVKMPEDFGLRNENSTIYSDYFGFSMTLPESWELLDKQKTATLKQFGYLALEKQNEPAQAWTEKSLQNTEILFATLKKDDQKNKVRSLLVGAEKLSIPRFLPEAVAALYIREMLDKNEEVVGGVNKTKIDDVDFAWFETVDKNTKDKQRIYYANLKNLAFMIVFTYQSDDDLKVFLEKLNTVKFKK